VGDVAVVDTKNIKPLSPRVLMNLREGALYVGRIKYREENIPLVDVAVPIVRERKIESCNGNYCTLYNKSTLVGVLAAEVDLSHIWSLVMGVSRGKGHYAFIVDDMGNLLIHPEGYIKKFKWKEIPPIKAIVNRTWDIPAKKLPIYIGSHGIKVVGVASHIKGTHWGVVVERSASEFFKELNILAYISLSVSAIILLLCIWFAYRYFIGLLSPFDELQKGVSAITEGNLKYRIDIKTGDEIELLAKSFNDMAKALEERKKERDQAILELQEKQKQLEQSNMKLKEAYQLRSEFLTNISHELRTPMNTITGYTSIILDGIYGEINEKQRRGLNKVLQNARSLSRLINDMLDFSKLESGKMPIFKERFLISQVIKESVQSFKSQIAEKGLELHIDIKDDIEMENDRTKIKQILEHLLSNAVKFTKKGSITIVAEKPSQSEYVKISVSDTGIGIKEEDIEKIFDEFRQLDGSFTREYGGTGLGLAICKKLLKLLNAKITVQSKPNKGSTFTVHIPITPIKKKSDVFTYPIETIPLERELVSEKEEEEDITKKVILCIDDDPNFLEIMKDIVKGTDYRVIGVNSPQKGLELARKIRPYLITVDILMPQMGGLEIVKKLKSDPITLDIPIFVISIADERAKAYSLGVSEYFIKPIDKDHFLKVLQELSRVRGRRVLVIDDDHSFLESFFLIMREHGFQITTCDNGREGMQKLKQEMPDVLILDLMMPEISGYDILDFLEKEGLKDEIPVILITAKELTKEELEQVKGRVFSVFRKTGITREELAPKIKSVFKRIWSEEVSNISYPKDKDV